MTALQAAAFKAFPANTDIDYLMEALSKFPQGEWFEPSNRNGGNDFSVCMDLSFYNLIESKRTPQFVKGQFFGVQISFLYKYDLEY